MAKRARSTPTTATTTLNIRGVSAGTHRMIRIGAASEDVSFAGYLDKLVALHALIEREARKGGAGPAGRWLREAGFEPPSGGEILKPG